MGGTLSHVKSSRILFAQIRVRSESCASPKAYWVAVKEEYQELSVKAIKYQRTQNLWKEHSRLIYGDNLQPTKFRHTPEEKAEFVRDFLRALRVPSVDLILCHSSALFPGLYLSLENKGISVNSLALVNPTGLDIPRLLKPVWLTKPLVRLSEFPLGYKLTETQVVPFQTLLSQNFPVLLAFSHNDKLISKRTSYKMAEMMVDAKDVIIYDKEGKAHGSGGINPFRKVMAFEKGSHFLFRTYPDIISEAISSFLFHQVENRVK
ncbi:hypothetical protein AVEN_59299-1 [Araneus ventricosus]|uniref:Uncharacterized protein n=1 Tax=Araneus ventricosus TaxID=182803 RepID=A0A4Y2G8Z5_ARAVE|nr:hypothetical protein AVEN_59299-1 [Araneus ventricosus]